MRVIYSDGFDLFLGDHIFPSIKYRLVKDRLLDQALIHPSKIVEPKPANDEDVALVHTSDYIQKLKNGKFTMQELMRLEVPYSKELVNAVRLGVGGTTQACKLALLDGICLALCGGFHHAFANHGEGFCLLNDIAIAIRVLLRDGFIQNAMTVDCDVHHGNGTASIFEKDPSVYTLSIHQRNNYPFVKPPSSMDIHLDDGTPDDVYLEKLTEGLNEALQNFAPDLILYLAGADPYMYDQLGGLNLTIEGLKERDKLVFETAVKRNIPVAVTLAGGYARSLEDTVTIHTNTILTATEAQSSIGIR